MKSILLVGALALSPFVMQDQQDQQERAKARKTRPVDVFAELDGRWKGSFVGYDAAGIEQYRIQVEQTYKTVDANTQTVVIRDQMQDGKVITGKGKNTARRAKDGSLILKCEVTKSTGETVVHDGRIVTGPSGGKQIVWYSKAKDRTETFREWVATTPGKRPLKTYFIQGMGRYGDSLYLMAGEYRKLR